MQIFDFLEAPLFWLATAISSIILSIIANLATPKVARLLSTFSTSARTKHEVERKRIRSQVVLMHNNPQMRMNAKLDAIIYILSAIFFLACVIFFISVASVDKNAPPLIRAISNLAAALWVIPVVTSLNLFTDTIRVVRLADEREKAKYEYVKNFEGNIQEKDVDEFLDRWDLHRLEVSSDKKLSENSNQIESSTKKVSKTHAKRRA